MNAEAAKARRHKGMNFIIASFATLRLRELCVNGIKLNR
jgi:hypothetical protein